MEFSLRREMEWKTCLTVEAMPPCHTLILMAAHNNQVAVEYPSARV